MLFDAIGASLVTENSLVVPTLRMSKPSLYYPQVHTSSFGAALAITLRFCDGQESV